MSKYMVMHYLCMLFAGLSFGRHTWFLCAGFLGLAALMVYLHYKR